jgi:repressor LexA
MGLMENKRPEYKDTSEKILEAIRTYTNSNGYSPTIRELAKMTGLKSSSTVHRQLEVLESRGKIARGMDKARTIRVLEDHNQEDSTVKGENELEIIETLGMLSDHLDERLREINIVRYKGKQIGYDIRTFAADYKCEDEGITLTIGEIKKLRDLLNVREF